MSFLTHSKVFSCVVAVFACAMLPPTLIDMLPLFLLNNLEVLSPSDCNCGTAGKHSDQQVRKTFFRPLKSIVQLMSRIAWFLNIIVNLLN